MMAAQWWQKIYFFSKFLEIVQNRPDLILKMNLRHLAKFQISWHFRNLKELGQGMRFKNQWQRFWTRWKPIRTRSKIFILQVEWFTRLDICFRLLYIHNIRTGIVGGQWRHKITIYGNGSSVYIHIWQIRDVTNRQLFTCGY